MIFMQIKVPVIVVGCKLDLRDDQQPTLEQVMAPLMHEFREIETCIECSSIKQIQVLPCEVQQLFSDGFLDRVIVLLWLEWGVIAHSIITTCKAVIVVIF